ncbi:MAG: hypothetical protein HY291_09505 [Planctomycetes bacterium]|nr:hypothetical protein [Planctomycetota bacterium]
MSASDQTLSDLPSTHVVRGCLARVRRRWLATDLAAGALRLLGITLALLLVLGIVEMLARPGAAWRIGLMLVALGFWLASVWRWLVRPARERITDARAAVKVESAFPQLENALINAVQLAVAVRLPAPALAAAAIDQAALRVQALPVERAVSVTPIKRAAMVLGAAALCFALIAGVKGPAFVAALQQLLRPTAFVPAVGDHPIVSVKPGDCSVLAGGELNVEVEVAPYEGEAPEATLYVREEGAPREQAVKMEMAERVRFLAPLREIRKALVYRVEIGTSQSALYKVSIVERPRVDRIDLSITPPAYTGLKSERYQDVPGDIRAPQGSKVELTAHSDRVVTEGAVVIEETDAVPLTLGGEGQSLTGAFEIKRSGYYTIRLKNAGGHTNAEGAPHKIECIPDRPPAVRIAAPVEKELTLGAGASVPIAVEATDDYGLAEVSVRFKRNREGVEQVLKVWKEFPPPGRAARVQAVLALTPEAGFEAGDTVYYLAEAKDRAQSSRTVAQVIKVIDPKKAKEEKIEALGDVLKRLEMVLQWQNAALAASDRHRDLALKEKKAVPAPEAARVLDAQAKIRAESAEVAKSITPSDKTLSWVREALAGLLADPMPKALVAAERVLKLAAQPADLAGPLNELGAEQRRIVAGLKSILAVLPKVAEAVKEEVDRTQGYDLPNDVKKELEDLKDKLKEFADQQKKTVKASEDLAKKPAEDLSEEEKKEMKALEANQDDWAKFMREAYSDFSKIPKQDFTDPRLLQELLQTYEEVEMAKDALSKKAAEIAVAVEESGVEDAKSLTTHIEKWLPDKPDREKWSMEEPIGDNQTPMAELPKELEDIMGDLMEKEEDLMEEANDLTSKWADSIDKGAGWDAADGPISNMSAQGVTGNQLPNTSEIGGRSGEGRQGKASGEMVGDTATGKGGRKTPTRLSPDPFQAGQINDTSKDPAGGATGGGKSGAPGGEGLEGPVPPNLKLSMERLSGRQAELRNQAERLNLNLKMMNYPSADLEKAIKEMKKFETDTKDGRYENIARQRPVLLKNLKAAQGYTEGVSRIARDGSPNLPRGVQDEILDALSGENAPKGYEDLLKGYYDGLIKGDAKPSPTPKK